HGYVEKPESEFKDKISSEWIVQIDPQWKGDWDGAKGDEGLVALYKELKDSNNAKDIRTLLDSDTKLYGANCGYTNPDATPEDPPTDGTATFSRGIVHAGPCEIWLDDKMVLQNDDCQSAYGDGTQETISVFKPVDYSSCASGGCMFRFYWLALQRLDGKTYWQVYKNCIPLSGPAGLWSHPQFEK
uniref:Mucin-like protein n=1 Tax=Phytophthora sojae TaxID=67593 RepID=UPI003AFB827B